MWLVQRRGEINHASVLLQINEMIIVVVYSGDSNRSGRPVIDCQYCVNAQEKGGLDPYQTSLYCRPGNLESLLLLEGIFYIVKKVPVFWILQFW